jgi:hypothetical protein
MAQVIEIEVDTPTNGNLFFLPAGRTIRGRFDFARDSEPMALVVAQQYPAGVPGQRLVLDTDAGEAQLVEALYFDQHKAVRKALEKRWSLGPERETFKVGKDDLATWVYWLNRAVQSGAAKVVNGALPASVPGKVRKSFITQPRKDPRDSLIEKLTAVLYATLPESKRAQVEALLAQADG